MRLPLFILNKPVTGQVSNSPMIGANRWRISSNHVDSELSLHIKDLSGAVLAPVVDGSEFKIDQIERIYIRINKAGNEKHLTIFVELVHDAPISSEH